MLVILAAGEKLFVGQTSASLSSQGLEWILVGLRIIIQSEKKEVE